MSCTAICAFVDVPPTMPKNSSVVWPAYAETSIWPLFIKRFVSIKVAARESTFVPLIAATKESAAPSPSNLKSNDIATAFVGTKTDIHAYAGTFVMLAATAIGQWAHQKGS